MLAASSSLDVATLAAVLSAAAILGAAGKWLYDRFRGAVIAGSDHSIKEIATTTAAADAIAKAAGAVVIMLQGELQDHADQLIAKNAQVIKLTADLAAITERENACQRRLDALEAQMGGRRAGD